MIICSYDVCSRFGSRLRLRISCNGQCALSFYNLFSTMLPKTMKAMTAMTAGVRALSKTNMASGIATSLTLKKRGVTKVIGALADLGAKEVNSVGKCTIP